MSHRKPRSLKCRRAKAEVVAASRVKEKEARKESLLIWWTLPLFLRGQQTTEPDSTPLSADKLDQALPSLNFEPGPGVTKRCTNLDHMDPSSYVKLPTLLPDYLWACRSITTSLLAQKYHVHQVPPIFLWGLGAHARRLRRMLNYYREKGPEPNSSLIPRKRKISHLLTLHQFTGIARVFPLHCCEGNWCAWNWVHAVIWWKACGPGKGVTGFALLQLTQNLVPISDRAMMSVENGFSAGARSMRCPWTSWRFLTFDFFAEVRKLPGACQQIYNRSDTYWFCFVLSGESLQTALLLSVTTSTVRSSVSGLVGIVGQCFASMLVCSLQKYHGWG